MEQYPPNAGAPKESWRESYIEFCSPCGVCVEGILFPAYIYSKTKYRLEKQADAAGFSCCNTNCWTWHALGLCGLNFILQMKQRAVIRERYNLKGNFLTGCLPAVFTPCCDIIHMEKEVISRETERGNILPKNVVKDQPEKHASAMQYAPSDRAKNVDSESPERKSVEAAHV